MMWESYFRAIEEVLQIQDENECRKNVFEMLEKLYRLFPHDQETIQKDLMNYARNIQ